MTGPTHTADLLRRLADDRLDAVTWENAPGDRYAAHVHPYDKIIVVAAGGIVFGLPVQGDRLELAVGDRLELPAGVVHDATVGPAGVSCLEAHRRAGSLSGEPCRRGAGDW